MSRHPRIGHAHKARPQSPIPSCHNCASTTHRFTLTTRRCDVCGQVQQIAGTDDRRVCDETVKRRLARWHAVEAVL